MTTEAVTTSEIEGEILDRASVQSSIRKQLGLTVDGELRHARYRRNSPLPVVRQVNVNEQGRVVEV